MNNTLSTFLRLSGDTGAFVAIPGEVVVFSCNRPAFDEEKEERHESKTDQNTYTHANEEDSWLI